MAISKKIAAIAASGALVLGVGTATVLTGQANTPPANLATSNNVAQLPAVAGTTAGRAGRVIAMDETQLLAFGPDTGLVLDALGKAIYK